MISFLIFFLSYSVSANDVCQKFEKLISEIKSCNPHDIHLTFDDGPRGATTDKILKALKERETKATFFVSTHNLEKHGELKEIIAQEINAGHTVADHGHEHKAYDLRIANGNVDKGYSSKVASEQINKSMELLNSATNGKFSRQKIKMFRFPYGRGAMPSPHELDYMEDHGQIIFQSKNYSERLVQYRSGSSHALASISDKGFSHLGWNYDSEDSREPAKELDDYVLDNLKRMCNSKEKIQVALFHDIKAINALAIPLIIDAGRCLGLKFISAQEMLQSQEYLIANGVLIPKDYQLKGAARQLDGLDKLIEKLSVQRCLPLTPPTKKSCKSYDGRIYQHCEGEDSICVDGEWNSRAKLILNRDQRCDLSE